MRWLFGFVLGTLLAGGAGCSSEAPTAMVSQTGEPVALTAEEQEHDPRPAAEQLIERRETPGALDHAIALLEWHVDRHPDDSDLQTLLAEAHSRAAEALDAKKPEDQEAHRLHRSVGLSHAEEAVKLAPESGAAHYWLAALELHAADVERSLGRAKRALGHLEKADKLVPDIDQAGPARLKGKILQELPGLFGGSSSRAIASYRRSLAIAPDCIETHLWLAQALADSHQDAPARSELEWVIAAKPRPGHEKEDGGDRKTGEELLRKLEKK